MLQNGQQFSLRMSPVAVVTGPVDPFTRGFTALDSDGVECSFSTDMTVDTDTAGNYGPIPWAQVVAGAS